MPAYKDSNTNTWYVQFYYLDWTGKRKHKVKRGFARKKDAEAYEIKFKSSDAPNQITIEKLVEEYRDYLQRKFDLGQIKRSTWDVKENYIKLYILPYFKDAKACEIKVKDVEKWLQVISVWPARKGADKTSHLSSKTKRSSMTVNTARQNLGQIFKFGMKNFGLTNDPTSLAERMRFHSNDERAKLWTVEQFNIFYEAITKEYYRVLFKLIFYSGIRLGEALALTPADIEQEIINGVIHGKLYITKTIVELHNGVQIINTPKTLHSARNVIIPSVVYTMLMEYISLLPIRSTDRIFPLKEANVRYYMSTVIARVGLPRISPHGLRHSYASIVYDTSKNLTVVAKQLGHANADVTARIYSHMLPGADEKAVEAINALALNASEND